MKSKFPPLKVAILVYPGCTPLDWIGPHMFMSTLIDTEIFLVAKKKGIQLQDPGDLEINIKQDFNDCPEDLDIFLVPGGLDGTAECLKDEETISFVKRVGGKAKYVTSVCTGSLILGAAGLLDGYKATSYWGVTHLLKEFGATFLDERVVVDRNRITGGGVTAGLDCGLELARILRGDDVAKVSQFAMEYDPAPGLNSGSLRTAEPHVVEFTRHMLGPSLQKIQIAVDTITT